MLDMYINTIIFSFVLTFCINAIIYIVASCLDEWLSVDENDTNYKNPVIA